MSDDDSTQLLNLADLLEAAAAALRRNAADLIAIRPTADRLLSLLEGYDRLSCRARKTLNRDLSRWGGGDRPIRTVSQLCGMEESEMWERRNTGKATVHEIKAWMARHNLHFKATGR